MPRFCSHVNGLSLQQTILLHVAQMSRPELDRHSFITLHPQSWAVWPAAHMHLLEEHGASVGAQRVCSAQLTAAVSTGLPITKGGPHCSAALAQRWPLHTR